MDLNTLAVWMSTIVALVSAGGLTLQQQRVSVLRADLDDARKRVEDVRGDLSDAEKDRANDQSRIAQLESDLRHAEQMATRQDQWAAMDQHLDLHHTEAMRAWTAIQKEIKALRENR